MTDRPRQCVELASSGEPCRGQPVALENDGVRRCLTHAKDPRRVRRREERNRGGGWARRRTANPDDIPSFPLNSHRAIVSGLRWLLRAALTNPSVDLRGIAEARQCIVAAIQARGVEVQEHLLEQIARLEHGERGVAVLTLQTSLSEKRMRPLPPKRAVASIVQPEQSAPGPSAS